MPKAVIINIAKLRGTNDIIMYTAIWRLQDDNSIDLLAMQKFRAFLWAIVLLCRKFRSPKIHETTPDRQSWEYSKQDVKLGVER